MRACSVAVAVGFVFCLVYVVYSSTQIFGLVSHIEVHNRISLVEARQAATQSSSQRIPDSAAELSLLEVSSTEIDSSELNSTATSTIVSVGRPGLTTALAQDTVATSDSKGLSSVPAQSPAEQAAVNQLAVAVASQKHPMARIPKQILFVAKPESMAELQGAVKTNVERTAALNPDFKVRWLGDNACLHFLQDNGHAELAGYFTRERRGSYRGDICRAAVLAKEGGFYVDADVELSLPFSELASESTTFMSAFSEGGDDLLNAVIAVKPGSSVMQQTLDEMLKLYQGKAPPIPPNQWMGPKTLKRAMEAVLQQKCPSERLDKRKRAQSLQWSCDDEEIRLYHEHRLQCWRPNECAGGRDRSSFLGVQFGIFTPDPERKVVMWPRFAGCRDWGCQAGGWTVGAMR